MPDINKFFFELDLVLMNHTIVEMGMVIAAVIVAGICLGVARIFREERDRVLSCLRGAREQMEEWGPEIESLHSFVPDAPTHMVRLVQKLLSERTDLFLAASQSYERDLQRLRRMWFVKKIVPGFSDLEEILSPILLEKVRPPAT